ncbi:MAG TPA: CRISPR system precrRNA processing endoribonuclease RAMP protein Cas6 [Bryobacteraceae bacterium]|nr:CRISPR system precrRNA processing endoribonuclease RAMP protein Cas6 [Bryobacteraceae bacterium]
MDALTGGLRELGLQGVGPGRGRMQMVGEAKYFFDAPLSTRDSGPVSRFALEFSTPTELKVGGETLREPRFDAVFSRARDRISTLMTAWQGGAPLLDFRRLADQAQQVRLVTSSVTTVDVTRRSTRTGHSHSLGGFTGRAVYEGDARELMPILRAAWWTGIGRHTVWGNGAVRIVD